MGPGTGADGGLDFVDEFAAAAEWFADLLGRTPTSTPVPTCPGWSVLDLAGHLGNVHSWAASVVETGRAATVLDDEPGSDRPRKVAGWYSGRAEDLYAVLRDTPGDRPCWNFAFGDGVAGFWGRRQTHETVMHGIDLAVAAGRPERLPVRLALDGVDEALTVFLHRMHSRGHPADLDVPLVLRADDAEAAWTVQPPARGAEPVVLREALDGADVVEAPAGVLLKVLWKRARPTDAAVRISGDDQRVGRFLASRLTP